MYKIGLYAICKNEIIHIEKWLNTYKNVDQIVIIDTGSTDGTWEKLQSFALIFPNLYIEQKTWEPFNFGAAKQYALDKLRAIIGDVSSYVFACFDLDEFCPDLERLRTEWDNTYDTACIKAIVPKGDMSEFFYVTHKIHSNNPGFGWFRSIHEALRLNNSSEYKWLDLTSLTYTHEQDSSKLRPYDKLLELDLEQNPNDCDSLAFLIGEYCAHARFDEAAKLLKHLEEIEWNDDFKKNIFYWQQWCLLYHIYVASPDTRHVWADRLFYYMKDSGHWFIFYIQKVIEYSNNPRVKTDALLQLWDMERQPQDYSEDKIVYLLAQNFKSFNAFKETIAEAWLFVWQQNVDNRWLLNKLKDILKGDKYE